MQQVVSLKFLNLGRYSLPWTWLQGRKEKRRVDSKRVSDLKEPGENIAKVDKGEGGNFFLLHTPPPQLFTPCLI